MPDPSLTEKQSAILAFIQAEQAEHGIPPSTRDIQRKFRYASQNAVMNHLRALAKRQRIERINGRTWGLKAGHTAGPRFSLPVYGTIPAGRPAMQEQVPDESIEIDPALFGLRRARRDRAWALRVSGDSMINAHIVAGDLVVLERRPPRAGDIIAALVDETTTTLKRLRYDKGVAVLRAENPRYPDIIPEHGLECQGVVVGVIRQVRA
ncbi:MAG: transcriptional repressor LexA [Opitutaceae bacterium]